MFGNFQLPKPTQIIYFPWDYIATIYFIVVVSVQVCMVWVCVLAHVITRTEIHVCLIMKFCCEQNRDLMWFLFHSKAFNSACVCAPCCCCCFYFRFFVVVLFCLLHSRLSIFIDFHWHVRYWLRARLRVLLIYCTLRSRSIDHLFSLLLQQQQQ